MSLRVHHAPPTSGTTALAQLVADLEEIILFVAVTRDHADRVDEMRKIAAKALAGVDGEGSENAIRWEGMKKEAPGPAVKKLQEFVDLQRKTTFASGVDAFLSYVANLLKIIHLTRPEMLRTEEKVSFSEISQFSRMKDLTDYLIDKRVMDLTFKSIHQLQQEIETRHGFRLMRNRRSLDLVARYIEKRNLLIHNGGIVNRRYLQRTGDSRQKLGESIRLGSPIDVLSHLQLVARSADARAIEKFKIRRTHLAQIKSRFSNG